MLNNIENGAAHVFKWLLFISSSICAKSIGEGKTPGSFMWTICKKESKANMYKEQNNCSCQMDFEALACVGGSLGFMCRYTKHIVYLLLDL